MYRINRYNEYEIRSKVNYTPTSKKEDKFGTSVLICGLLTLTNEQQLVLNEFAKWRRWRLYLMFAWKVEG